MAYWTICKGLCKKIWEYANSRLGESVWDLYMAKIRQGEVRVVYSIINPIDYISFNNLWHADVNDVVNEYHRTEGMV